MRNCEPWFSHDTDVALGAEENYFGHDAGSCRWCDSSALAEIPSALGCSGWRKPLRFIGFISASILSLFCTLANPHHAGDAYMALDRVVARAAGDKAERVCRQSL